MTLHYTKDQLEEKMSELEHIDKRSIEFFFKYMKIVISLGRPTRISEYGVLEGKKLYKRWLNKEELTRHEEITIGFLISEISVLEENEEMLKHVHDMYDNMTKKYKPDVDYMVNFVGNVLIGKKYLESNPNYMQTIENMFVIDEIVPSNELKGLYDGDKMPDFRVDLNDKK
jgi:hypothetical protein